MTQVYSVHVHVFVLIAEIYRANALPSAGAMPFLQTVMCDLNGGSDDYKTDMPLYPNAT